MSTEPLVPDRTKLIVVCFVHPVTGFIASARAFTDQVAADAFIDTIPESRFGEYLVLEGWKRTEHA